jgi:hypothetical protein
MLFVRFLQIPLRKVRASIRRPRIPFQIPITVNENVGVAGHSLLVAVQFRSGPLLVAVQARPGESGRHHSSGNNESEKKLFERMFHDGSPARGRFELSGH